MHYGKEVIDGEEVENADEAGSSMETDEEEFFDTYYTNSDDEYEEEDEEQDDGECESSEKRSRFE